MAIDITMPALSPTMESGTLAKWLVKPGDAVKSGDVIAEIETDKATMEVEAVDEGEVLELLVAEGAENVKVNSVIARLKEEGEDAEVKAKPAATPPAAKPEPAKAPEKAEKKPVPASAPAEASPPPQAQPAPKTGRVIASPLARRIATQQGIDLSTLKGSGPNGRIVRADVEAAPAAATAPASKPAEARPAPAPAVVAQTQQPGEAPYEAIKLSNMRRVIARRLSESKQTVPHFYLTVDIRLDPLLELRQQLNTALEKRGVKLSVNDLLLKAQAVALVQVPDANVSFQGDHLRKFSRPDISVAVAIPGGLITPVIRDAAAKSLSTIATEMKELAARAREGKLQPPEYTGGTASISNLGMYGIKQFDAVINPPEGLILAVGAGEKRPYVVNDQLAVATVLSATGSFDHRAIDGAVGAEFMAAFKALVEQPIGMLA